MADTTHSPEDDDGFHEIHLSGKQLVFLFMATTVVLVGTFLCGVLVGRGVDTAGAAETAAAAVTARPPAASPPPEPAAAPAATPVEPPSPPAGDELSYRKRLESEGSGGEEKLKATDRVEPPARAAVKPAAPVTPPATAAPIAKPAPAAIPAGGRPGRWVVQLVALRDRNAAASIVQRLTGRGYPAFIVNPTASGSGRVYKVQVGRYDDKNEAERISRRLEKEEKFNPWISATR